MGAWTRSPAGSPAPPEASARGVRPWEIAAVVGLVTIALVLADALLVGL